jgi:NitT/TauT family transport system substrate-binding protein
LSGDIEPYSYLASGKLIREEPELVEQFVKTHERATQYVNEHPDEAAEIYSSRRARTWSR